MRTTLVCLALLVVVALSGCRAQPTPTPTQYPSPIPYPGFTATPTRTSTPTPAVRALWLDKELHEALTPIPAISPERERAVRGWLWSESEYAPVAVTNEAIQSLLAAETETEFENLVHTGQVVLIKRGTPILFVPDERFAIVYRLEYPEDNGVYYTALDYIISSEVARYPRSARRLRLAGFPDSVFPLLTPIPSMDVLDEYIGWRGWIHIPDRQVTLAVKNIDLFAQLFREVRTYDDAQPYLDSMQVFAIESGTPVLLLGDVDLEYGAFLLLVRVLSGEHEGKVLWVLGEDVVLTTHQ